MKGLKIDKHPQLKEIMFYQYRRVLYFSQEEDEALIDKAQEIAKWLELPLEIRHVTYGDLERRLVAIIEDREQPVSQMTVDGFSGRYPLPG